MSAPKTQRAWALYDEDGVFVFADKGEAIAPDTGVLVVPEAAVKWCRHSYPDGIGHCKDCGAFREWDDDADRWGRWQRPLVLRVGRAK